LVVADGVTGSGRPVIFRSTNSGISFPDSTRFSTGTEIPGLAGSRLKKNQIFATNWGAGYVRRSVDYGKTWANLISTSEGPWGIGVARDDPNVVVFGDYTSGIAYVSVDSGATFTSVSGPPGFFTSHSFFLGRSLDDHRRNGQQSMEVGRNVRVHAGVGRAGCHHGRRSQWWRDVDSEHVSYDHLDADEPRRRALEYRRAGEPWQWIADVPGYANSYSWLVPSLGSTQVKVRVSDAWDGSPSDSSNAVFSVPGAYLAETPGSLDFGTVDVSTTPNSRSRSPIRVHPRCRSRCRPRSRSRTHSGRTGMTLAAGQQDTVGVWFMPSSCGELSRHGRHH
jgi:hypothetical protein